MSWELYFSRICFLCNPMYFIPCFQKACSDMESVWHQKSEETLRLWRSSPCQGVVSLRTAGWLPSQSFATKHVAISILIFACLLITNSRTRTTFFFPLVKWKLFKDLGCSFIFDFVQYAQLLSILATHRTCLMPKKSNIWMLEVTGHIPR